MKLALFALLALLSSHGCVDDREKVRREIFLCDPSSPTASSDCGDGFTCYSAAQALGSSICVPTCDPADAKSCDGACTLSGACLSRCTVPDEGQPNPCRSPLTCRRVTDSPLERALGPDGVCLPIHQSCSSSADCTSPIFDGCSSEVTGATQSFGLLTSGEVCIEANCAADGIACEPGSECIKDILPKAVPAPDLCSPVCDSVRARKPGSLAFNECIPGLTCLSDAFPSSSSSACAPGLAGWICVDNLGCTVGACKDWGDVDSGMTGFLTCSPRCNSDDDCVPFDRGANPSLVTKFTCHHTPDGAGWCRSLASLFFPLTCLHDRDDCQLDDQQPNDFCTVPPPAQIPDGGLVVCGGVLTAGPMGLGALGGTAPTCRHPCTMREDCVKLSAAAQVPMRCEPADATHAFCTPEVPFATHCDGDDDCFGGLRCVDLGGGFQTCSLDCMSSDDCAHNDALGTTFACTKGLCTPRIESGCSAADSDSCMSGQADASGKCVSPTGWSCNLDTQCASGSCAIFAGTSPPWGLCQ